MKETRERGLLLLCKTEEGRALERPIYLRLQQRTRHASASGVNQSTRPFDSPAVLRRDCQMTPYKPAKRPLRSAPRHAAYAVANQGRKEEKASTRPPSPTLHLRPPLPIPYLFPPAAASISPQKPPDPLPGELVVAVLVQEAEGARQLDALVARAQQEEAAR